MIVGIYYNIKKKIKQNNFQCFSYFYVRRKFCKLQRGGGIQKMQKGEPGHLAPAVTKRRGVVRFLDHPLIRPWIEGASRFNQ